MAARAMLGYLSTGDFCRVIPKERHPQFMRQNHRFAKARFAAGGSTLAEAIIACAIVSLFFGSVYAGGWRSLHALRSALEGTTASQQLMNLEEQVRTSSWATITNATNLSTTAFANSSAGGHLSNLTQAIYVNPYPIPGGYTTDSNGPPNYPVIGGQTIEAACSSNGTVSTPYTGNGQLASQTAVRVDIVVSWTPLFNRTTHWRMVSMVVSQGGIVGQH
jgi:hypothetical protein